MNRLLVFAAAVASAAVVAAVAFAIPGQAAVPRLTATVGPGDTITLRTAGGKPVRTLPAGTYAVVVHDRSTDHNFRLVGPGVNRATGVGATATVTWRVKLQRGKLYRFACDPHADDMRGAFRTR